MTISAKIKNTTCKVLLGISTDSYDCDGKTTATSDLASQPLLEIEKALASFQGTVQQIPPMFSAKKIDGKKLYELARTGIEIERKPVTVTSKPLFLTTPTLTLSLNISCSKGTYVRSIAHDLGLLLGCGAHLSELRRLRSGSFHVKDSINGAFFMIIDNSCTDIPPLSAPIALTIGTFDGVHLGHQYLFQELKKRGTAVVLTFSNHPAEVLHPEHATSLDRHPRPKTLLASKTTASISSSFFLSPQTSLPSLRHLSSNKFVNIFPFPISFLEKALPYGHNAQGTENNIRALATRT